MPDLALTPRTAAFRREFYRRWGRENCVVSGRTRRAEYRDFCQTLSLKCVARGTEIYFLDRRRIAVSDDTWLVLNEGRTYGSVLDAPNEAYSFSIFFRPGFAQEVAGELRRGLDQVLDDGAVCAPAPVEFAETLRAHDSRITPVLRFIQRQIAAGLRDERWLEEQFQFLLARLVTAQQRQPDPGLQLAATRRSRRVELRRRLELAADFMHERLQEDISLADIAAAAHLSRFHFLRLFQTAYGHTPVAHLRQLRTRRALALAESTTLSAGEIADRVGLSRITLWRAFRARGLPVRALRYRLTRPAVAFLGREH